ncbi:hypothetical protein [Gluconobacter oxydans]|uniref:hypothetical protein n=1 Tax=Gluconobacter oxydans TaxID=442 RepID=UPI00078117E0|nr:hypothetical protein [Gluconobacter oxydans]KXV13957.1 hypothetical protein AD932_03485 [Gluconobacter oxydans]
MANLSNLAENRLSMLEHQRDVTDQMLASATECERENEGADWDGVIATLTDTKANLDHQIDTISDWDQERLEDIAYDRADYMRQLRLEDA